MHQVPRRARFAIGSSQSRSALMAIIAAQGRGDAKGAAWILAGAALESIHNADVAARSHIAINNTYRLLQSFSGSDYFATPQPSIYPNSGHRSVTPKVGMQENVSDVAVAIQGALSDAFSGMDVDDAVSIVNSVLKALFDRSAVDEHNSDVGKTVKFFESLRNRLEAL